MGKKIMETAEALAWPKGTKKSKYSYKHGRATAAFRKAFNRVAPHHSGWSAPSRKGASCDVAVMAVMRSSGVCKSYPRGRSEQQRYKPKKCRRIVYKNARPADVAKPNDVVIYCRGGGRGHTLIRGKDIKGRFWWAEAAYGKTYFHKYKDAKKLHRKYRKVIILREK